MPHATMQEAKTARLEKEKASWLNWLKSYTPKKFLESFLRNVEGAQSTCQYCHEPIYVDVLIGGGVPDWSTAEGDFGCEKSPETCEEGVGSHMPMKRNS